jgi:HsdM N-terminal domain
MSLLGATIKPAMKVLRGYNGMFADHMQGLEKFESGLWKIADNLRANSNLASNEYFMPIMGLIFLRHATNRRRRLRSTLTRRRARCRIVRWSRPISRAAAR